MSNFRQFIERIAPTVWRGPNGERYVGVVLGLMSDLLAEGATQAIRAPWIHLSTHPDDALEASGGDRNMESYATETPTGFRARLRRAWTAWEFAGSETGDGSFGAGIVGQYEATGLTVADLVENHEWDRPWPHDSTNWSRFWLIFDPPHSFTWMVWGGATWGSFNWGILPTGSRQLLCGIGNKFRPAHVIMPRVFVKDTVATVIWGHNMTWASFTWGEGKVASIPC